MKADTERLYGGFHSSLKRGEEFVSWSLGRARPMRVVRVELPEVVVEVLEGGGEL